MVCRHGDGPVDSELQKEVRNLPTPIQTFIDEL